MESARPRGRVTWSWTESKLDHVRQCKQTSKIALLCVTVANCLCNFPYKYLPLIGLGVDSTVSCVKYMSSSELLTKLALETGTGDWTVLLPFALFYALETVRSGIWSQVKDAYKTGSPGSPGCLTHSQREMQTWSGDNRLRT